MENITENNQTHPQIDAEILNQFNKQNDKKECKTCGSKDSKSSTFSLITFGVIVLFTSFYGIIRLVQDIVSFFTR